MAELPRLAGDLLGTLMEGIVIPAHPLALDARRKFDERRQRALTRYYLDSGAGGLAVGVHSTQFEIREPRYGLFQPVLALAAQTIDAWEQAHRGARRVVRIAGICGQTAQAVREAQLARETGYQVGLLSLGALKGFSVKELLDHAAIVAREIPLFGFYLQGAAGGIPLPYPFWRGFLDIPNVVGIKIAPFNRYQTLDVVRALAESGRVEEVALYTGNDDHIMLDLLSEYEIPANGRLHPITIKGGILGHWACWTSKAVALNARCRQAREERIIPADLLALAAQVTDCNAAFFDAAHNFTGALSGINEVLYRQGLLESNVCLNENERLSPGQMEAINRVYHAYPDLNDDEFVAQNLDYWLE